MTRLRLRYLLRNTFTLPLRTIARPYWMAIVFRYPNEIERGRIRKWRISAVRRIINGTL